MQKGPNWRTRVFSCVLLGVSEESKAYRLYDPTAKRIVISRDVIFEEEKQWDWDKSYEEQVLMNLEWGDEQSEGEVDEIENEENGEDANSPHDSAPNLLDDEEARNARGVSQPGSRRKRRTKIILIFKIVESPP